MIPLQPFFKLVRTHRDLRLVSEGPSIKVCGVQNTSRIPKKKEISFIKITPVYG